MRPSPSPADLGRSLLGLLPSAATAVAEGGWIAVVYAALQFAVSGRAGTLGPWTFIALAAIGMVIVRLTPSDRAHDAAVATLVVASAIGGLFSDPAVRAAVANGHLDGLVTGGWGWLLGIATWRGTRHRDPLGADSIVASLLTWVVPALSVPWLIGSGSSQRQAFVDSALPATLLFVTAGLIAVGLTRLDALGRLAGVDWRRNRAWLAMLVGVAGLVALIATPIAWLLNASAEASARTLLGPAIAAADVVAAIVAPVGDTIGGFLPAGSNIPAPVQSPDGEPGSALATWIEAFVLTGVLAVMVGVLIVFHRIVNSEPRAETVQPGRPSAPMPVSSPRPADVGPIRLPRLTFGRRATPRTASQAYLAVLDRLETDERVRRGASESPAAHARRLRAIGVGTLSLDLLAADFELERYRGATLTPHEIRKAIERSRIGPHAGRDGLKGAHR